MQSLLKTVILLVAALVIGQCQQGTTPYNQTAMWDQYLHLTWSGTIPFSIFIFPW
jgi:hypothetical protein